jgi:hypothetical protein
MSNANFQERIQRINANPGHSQPVLFGGPQSTAAQAPQKPNLIVVCIGAFLMSLGLFIIKDLNENYEILRESPGLGYVMASALCSVTFILTGCIFLLRAFSKKRATRNSTASQSTGHGEHPARNASIKARIRSSVLGLVFGISSCISLFLAGKATKIPTEAAQQIYEGALAASIFLLVLSVLVGFVGLFLRRSALARVPVCFLIGALATFLTIQKTGMGIREIEYILSALQ